MPKTSKKLTAAVRKHAKRAWEAEMRAALEPLAAKFDLWRAGRMSTADLDEAIHAYHNGVAREIWRRFATNDPKMPLAHAVAIGAPSMESLPSGVAEHIAPLVGFFQAREQDG
jgi:hypothetical protein